MTLNQTDGPGVGPIGSNSQSATLPPFPSLNSVQNKVVETIWNMENQKCIHKRQFLYITKGKKIFIKIYIYIYIYIYYLS